jgi:hypothetical protein
MFTPDDLRAQAYDIRQLAHRPRKRGRGRSERYLLTLADRFEAEARDLESRRAGDKPKIALPQAPAIDLGPLIGKAHN